MRIKSNATHLLIALLCAMLLSGCGLAMGKKVDFGSDYQNLDDEKMKELAGKTYFITNEDDYQQLNALKSELRTLVNSGTPNRFTIIDKTSGIAQITKNYYSGALGAIYPSRWLDEEERAWFALVFGFGLAFSMLADLFKKTAAK
jgi:protein involved in sex pheromone biosynthesis